jgi:Rieske Fe-S protein
VALDQVPEGSAHLFDYPGRADPAILVHLPGGELRAFSQKCTHLGCVVYYQPERGEMECPCHEGHFDAATGEVLAGPPQRPLGRIDVEVRDGTVWALAARGEGGPGGEARP